MVTVNSQGFRGAEVAVPKPAVAREVTVAVLLFAALSWFVSLAAAK